MSTSNKDDNFFARIVSLADALATDFDVLEAANLLVNGCVDFLPVRDAGIVVENEQHRLQVLATTSEETRIMEFLELQSNEGPCLEAFDNGTPVEAPDLIGGGERWPTFRTNALGLGFRSAYAVPLHMHDRTIGALNLFCTTPRGLDDREIETAGQLATMATLGIMTHWTVSHHETLSRQLQHALDSRVVIEQAKGVVAERSGVSMGTAFELIRSAARSSRRPLVEVAEDVVRGRLPIDATRRALVRSHATATLTRPRSTSSTRDVRATQDERSACADGDAPPAAPDAPPWTVDASHDAPGGERCARPGQPSSGPGALPLTRS